MRILDRYIFKSVFSTFVSCIFVFLFLYTVIDVLSNLEDILKNHVQISLLVKYYLNYLPIMFVQVAPFASLLSTLYAFGKLNYDNELIAMRTSGLNIYEITKTVIIFGIIVSLFIFWINDRFAPQSSSVTQKIREEIELGVKKAKSKAKKQDIIQNLSMYGQKNRLYFINKFQVSTNTMEGITILEHDDRQNVTKKIVANRGVYKDGHWRFYQSITYNFDLNGQIIGEPHFLPEEVMAIPETPQDFLSQRQRPELMAISQLNDYIWRLSKSGATTVIRNLKIDLYQKFLSPFTNIIIILLGIPFALMMKRRAAGLASIGLAIMVGFLYYILDAISIALGKSGVILPLLSASLSHIIALLFSIYLIERLP